VNIVAVREHPVTISRFSDPMLPGGGLTTSLVALTTDVRRNGRPIVGYGFSSFGRYAQSGLIGERFAPRLLAASDNLDPIRAWDAMMTGEKPGGHGERCVAVGTLDMAIWDAAAKIEDVPLCVYLARRFEREPSERIRVYAGGGYRYPHNDLSRLRAELQGFTAAGYTHAKIKIGGVYIAEDLHRIEAAIDILGAGERLSVDAMNGYGPTEALEAAEVLKRFNLWWFEDICDPLDFATHACVAEQYPAAIAAGEALFSLAEAKLLHQYAGLRPTVDRLVFDPVHCYGIPGYAQIVSYMEDAGWPRSAFWPHGGHLFTQHVAAAFGLGGAEVNPTAFPPFGGLADTQSVEAGQVRLPDAPGIGFELRNQLFQQFNALG
jgi:L-alanine-DL-glutamate epimerase-like enolase superfamily enzyme